MNCGHSAGSYCLSLMKDQPRPRYTGACVGLCCRDMFCAGRVVEDDLKRTMQACGGSIVTTVSGLSDDVLGTCELFEEKQLGGERSVSHAGTL